MKVALVMWPDTFEWWYRGVPLDRESYLDGYDGEWSITTAIALRAADVDVHLVFATTEETGTHIQRPSGASVHFLPASASYRALTKAVWGHRWWERAQPLWRLAPYAAAASPALVTGIGALSPDVVVIQDYESPRFDVLGPLLRLAGHRVVAIDTGGSAVPSRSPAKRATARAAHRLLAIHDTEAERVRRCLRHPDVGVWPVPFRSDLFEPRDRGDARARLGLSADARLVVSAGRLHPVKGLDDLLTATEDLDCELALIGSGPEEERLRATGHPRMRIVDRLPAAQLVDWYAAANVVSLPSRQEGMPAAVLEALACGRAVVAATRGGVADVVAPPRGGWRVPPRDVVALRRAISGALDDPMETDRRGAAGRDHVLARHSPEPAGRELARLLGP